MKDNCGNKLGSYFRAMGNPPGSKKWCCHHHKDLSEIPEPNWLKRAPTEKRMPLGYGKVLRFNKGDE